MHLVCKPYFLLFPSMASSFLWASLLLSTLYFLTTSATNSSSTTSANTNYSSIQSVCKATPYPDVCFNSLKVSISINLNPNIISYILHTVQIAISEVEKLSDLFSQAQESGIIEKQRGAIQDCMELHQITMSSLKSSASRISSGDSRKLSDASAFLSASLTNKNTCLEGLDSATGALKQVLVDSMVSSYKHVSNSLSILSQSKPPKSPEGHLNRRLMGFPTRKARRILQSTDDDDDDDDDDSNVLTVAADGTGNFTTISDAISFAPNNSLDRIFIYVREGVYEENVEIPIYKTNIVLLGDGSDVTFISGNRSNAGGWTTFRSATVGHNWDLKVGLSSDCIGSPNVVCYRLLSPSSTAVRAVSGEGFLARDITFENTAGPENGQAVALRVNADLAAIYRCTVTGYQDTLYAHSFRQFYRECDIYGTVDFIFGNAAVIFQGSNIIARLPKPGQFIAITAQGRDSPDEDTGISIQNCSILASDDLYVNGTNVKSYLGRPWREYSRTVYLESYIEDFIDPAGWKEWSGDQGLDTLYYGEYENSGPSSRTDSRVTWQGYHIMDYYDASNFTVSQFVSGNEWLDSTSFPYDDAV